MKKIYLSVTVLGCILLSLTYCTKQDLTGNGTRIGKPTILGTLYQSDGKTPAVNATVYLRNKNSLADTSMINELYSSFDSVTVTTDSKGLFAIDSVQKGTYVIECTDGDDNYALYDSVTVENMDEQVTLPADTLKPAGAIKGVIRLVEGGNSENVYVLAFGIKRFVAVESDGTFKMESLAEGSYDLRIVPGVKDYGTLDTAQIEVVSGDTTNLDTLQLPYNGIPKIKNLSIRYDTLKHIVSLSWSPIESQLIEGFNIYKNDDKFNESPVTDTFLLDSLITQGETYEYRVCVAKKDSTEGVKSSEVSVLAANYIPLNSTFEITSSPSDGKRILQNTFAIGTNDLFYTLCTGDYYCPTNQVNIYDSNFSFVGNLNINELKHPFELATDVNGRLFISDIDSSLRIIKNIFVFDQYGNLEKTIPVYQDSNSLKTLLFTVNNNGNLIFSSKARDSLYICDSSSNLIRSLGKFGVGANEIQPGISSITVDHNNQIYVNDYTLGIRIYNSNGDSIRFIDFKDINIEAIYYPTTDLSSYTNFTLPYVSGICIDPQTKRIFLAYNTSIIVLDENGKLITSSSNINLNFCTIYYKNDKIYCSATSKVFVFDNNIP